ncbi:MAG: hypothetical protein H7145_12095 [Akkermansiaceae bacterium]|nr:hypothetical protein [Armatimonadota bacterium]
MAEIKGIDGLSVEDLRGEITRGGKLVHFPYCFSVIIMTFRRSSDIYLIRKGEVALAKGWPFALVSLFVGWWGFPWGLIYTPIALFQTLAGGKDVTQEVMGTLQYSNAPEGAPITAPPIVGDTPPRNPWTPS